MSDSNTRPHVEVRRIEAAETRWLRHVILRPTIAPEDLVYPGDDDPLAGHFGAYIDGEQVGIASVYPQHEDGHRSIDRWRLRGMGVLPRLHRAGVGTAILQATFDHAKAHGATSYWCQARVVARAFYEHHGLAIRGELFEIAGVGPHWIMERTL